MDGGDTFVCNKLAEIVGDRCPSLAVLNDFSAEPYDIGFTRWRVRSRPTHGDALHEPPPQRYQTLYGTQTIGRCFANR